MNIFFVMQPPEIIVAFGIMTLPSFCVSQIARYDGLREHGSTLTAE
jgi:hypothetical protein